MKTYINKLDDKYIIKFTILNQTFTLSPVEWKQSARFINKMLRKALTHLEDNYITLPYDFIGKLKLIIKIILN